MCIRDRCTCRHYDEDYGDEDYELNPDCPVTGHGAPVTQLEFRDATTLVSASDDGTTRFWDVESGAEKGQDAQGTHGEAMAGGRFAFTKTNSKEQVVGGFIVTAKGDLVRVYEEEEEEGVADKDGKKRQWPSSRRPRISRPSRVRATRSRSVFKTGACCTSARRSWLPVIQQQGSDHNLDRVPRMG